MGPPTGEPVPSAGYIQDLALRPDGLWAQVEFTKRCAALIRAGEQRFCSAVFVFGGPDRKSGEAVRCFLHSLAMTDTPFIDGQSPISLSTRVLRRVRGGVFPMKVKRESLLEVLDKIEGDEIDVEQLHAAVEAAAATAAAVDGVKGEKPALEDKPEDEDDSKPTPPAEMSAPALADAPPPPAAAPALAAAPMSPEECYAKLESLAASAGLDIAGVLAKLEEMLAGGGAVGENPAALKDGAELAALRQTVKTLSASVSALTAKERKAEADAKAKADAEAKAAIDVEVEALVTSGRILRADVEAWRPLAHTDIARFRTLTATLTPAVPTGKQAAAHPPPEPTSPPIDETHPAIVELSTALDRMGVKDAERRKAALASRWKMVAG